MTILAPVLAVAAVSALATTVPAIPSLVWISELLFMLMAVPIDVELSTIWPLALSAAEILEFGLPV